MGLFVPEGGLGSTHQASDHFSWGCHVEPMHQAGAMCFNGAVADAQFASDLLAGFAGNQQLRDFAFAGGKFNVNRAFCR